MMGNELLHTMVQGSRCCKSVGRMLAPSADLSPALNCAGLSASPTPPYKSRTNQKHIISSSAGSASIQHHSKHLMENESYFCMVSQQRGPEPNRENTLFTHSFWIRVKAFQRGTRGEGCFSTSCMAPQRVTVPRAIQLTLFSSRRPTIN